jgi:acyl carrier protein
MTEQEITNNILTELERIFKTTMGNDISIDIKTKKSDIVDWDSLNHLNLVVELENKYNLSLTMEEIENLNSVQFIIDRIINKNHK